jgi:hypothetical protein
MTGIVILALAAAAAGWYVLTGYAFRYKRCRGLGSEPLGPGAASKRAGSKQCRECGGYGRVLRMAAAYRAGRRRGRRGPASRSRQPRRGARQ